MSIVTEPELTSRLFTKDEFFLMADMGWFENQRVEFIQGRIVDMAPVSNIHSIVVSLVQNALNRVFDTRFWIRPQMALDFTDAFIVPDIAVVEGSPRSHIAKGKKNPESAALVVEVSERSLTYDRGNKAKLCAAAGILDYWVVVLANRQVEVFRNPQAVEGDNGGFAYTECTVYEGGDSITPLAAPNASIPVADLLP